MFHSEDQRKRNTGVYLVLIELGRWRLSCQCSDVWPTKHYLLPEQHEVIMEKLSSLLSSILSILLVFLSGIVQF